MDHDPEKAGGDQDRGGGQGREIRCRADGREDKVEERVSDL